MQSKTRRNTLMSLAVISAIGVTDIASAQMLEEVVVTARKRAESLQDVPMAVSAFSTTQLQDAQISGIEDLERMTPNITLTETSGLQGGSVAIFVRGIGNDPGFSQGVGIYVDDVYMNRSAGTLLEVYDAERIEVLKGPQGNLYGRNTIGGAIKYISKEPSEEMMGSVEATVGSYDALTLKGDISGPIIGDTLLGSFGALYTERDGIQTNTFNGDEYRSKDATAFRGSLIWNASDTVRVKLAGDYNIDESAMVLANRIGVNASALGQGSFFLTSANGLYGAGTGVYQTPTDISLPADIDDVSTSDGDLIGQYEIESTTLALTVNWDFSDEWSLKSVTARRTTDHIQPFDFDGSEQQFIHTINDRKFEDLSQEFQLTYSSDSINAVMGLYYLDGDTEFDQNETTQYGRLLVVSEQYKNTTRDDRSDVSQSIYGSVDWNINDEWQLTVGGRYTMDEKEETQEADVTQTYFAIALSNEFLPSAILPGQEATVAASPNFAFWADPGRVENRPEDTYAKADWNEFSPSIKLTWFAGDDLMLYTGMSSGFKSGGFQRQSGFSTEFEPETVDSYTIGMKTTLLDGSLRLNGEIFYNDYQDKQLATLTLTGADLVERVGNVGELETSGAELEVTWLPKVDGLTLSMNVGYLDYDVKEYASFNDAGEPINIGDTTAIGFSPDWTVQTRVSYDFDIGDMGSMMIGADVAYRSESYTNSPIDLTNPSSDVQVQEEHAIVNAIASFRTADDRWRIALQGKNLEDKRVVVNTYDLTVFQTAGYNMPRTWALTVGYEF